MTGLFSKALTSPDGKIRIPINEDAGDKGQIEEYLHAYNGEGIQHIACGCRDIYATIETLRADRRVVHAGAARRLLQAGRPARARPRRAARSHGAQRHPGRRRGRGGGRLHQDPAAALLVERDRPIFFEFIQRKGDDGFGEGNFKALFESIEEDQIRRGVLTMSDQAA